MLVINKIHNSGNGVPYSYIIYTPRNEFIQGGTVLMILRMELFHLS